MKTHCLAIALLATAFVPLAGAQTEHSTPPALEKSQESDGETRVAGSSDDAPQSLRVQLEYIELSHEALTKLLFTAEPKTSDATPLRKQLQEMVEKNEAKVLETQIAAGDSNRKFTSESVSEFIYPTEYEPPTLEGSISSSGSSDSMQSDNRVTSMMPTAFDTRNIGSTLEVEPTLGADGNLIDIRIVAELTWHTGNTPWLENKDSIGNNHKVQMPDFYTLRLNTSLTCTKARYTLIGVQSPKDDKGRIDMTRKVVLLLKCDVLTVK